MEKYRNPRETEGESIYIDQCNVFSTMVIKGGRELTEDTQQGKGTTTYYYLEGSQKYLLGHKLFDNVGYLWFRCSTKN